MQLSQIPNKIAVAFATGGGKNTIPTASQIGTKAGAASYTDGFPPLTRTPLAAGGVPPSGTDMNGVLFDMSSVDRWVCAGGKFIYDAAFATAIGGYPKSAVIITSDGKEWRSLVDNNTAAPGAAGWLLAVGMQASAFNTIVGATTLTAAAHAGGTVYMGGGGNYTVTLPDVTTMPPGSRIEFVSGVGTAAAFISTVSGQLIYVSAATTLSTIPMSLADTLVLESDGARWIAVSGSNQLGYSNAFSKNLASNGYQKLPSGLIIQWGAGTTNSGGAANVTLPIAFPSAVLQVNLTAQISGQNGAYFGWQAVNSSVFSAFANAAVAALFSYIAIGY